MTHKFPLNGYKNNMSINSISFNQLNLPLVPPGQLVPSPPIVAPPPPQSPFNDSLQISPVGGSLLSPELLFNSPIGTPGLDTQRFLQRPETQTVTLARHIHTRNHSRPVQTVTVGEVQERYAHTDFVGIEDHTRYFNPSGAVSGRPIVIPGAESSVKLDYTSHNITEGNHIGIMGVDRTEQDQLKIRTSAQPQTTKDKVLQADGVMILNHPADNFLDHDLDKLIQYTLSFEDAAAFDGIEVFNDGHYRNSNKPNQVLEWVDKNFFARGLFPSVMSGTDDHADSHVTSRPSYTKILTTSKSESGVMASIRDGKTYVTKEADMTIKLDLQQAEIGDEIALQPGSTQRLNLGLDHIRPESKIQVIYNGQVLSEFSPDATEFNGYLDLNIQPSPGQNQGYIYLKGFDNKGKIYLATSPIVFQTQS